MILGKNLPSLTGNILVIRDKDTSGSYIPPETDTDTVEVTFPDQVITGSLTDMAGRRTSYALSAETGSLPANTLIPSETEEPAPETESAPETEPVPEAPPRQHTIPSHRPWRHRIQESAPSDSVL